LLLVKPTRIHIDIIRSPEVYLDECSQLVVIAQVLEQLEANCCWSACISNDKFFELIAGITDLASEIN